ncbi:hypothetical protein MFUR16E_04430 [Methylobacterium fujisawaense]|uniref:hypothetical protein n=1 Tax=Methylobacterium fujisawaense TaxID=107400 RepID=UPI002F31D59E
MIRLRTYQCLDAAEPEARRYLAVVDASGIAMNFTGASALDAQGKAKAWMEAQREKAKGIGRSRSPRRVTP